MYVKMPLSTTLIKKMEQSLRSLKMQLGLKLVKEYYLITELQLAGKKRMLVKDYLNGNNIFEVDSKFE